MSEIRLNILAADGDIHGRVHGSDGDRVIAALAADPVTIADLDTALGRYRVRRDGRSFFAHFRTGVCNEPWDAGIIYIDLPGRLIASKSTYSTWSHRGEILAEAGLASERTDVRHSHDHPSNPKSRPFRDESGETTDDAADDDDDPLGDIPGPDDEDRSGPVEVPYHLAADWKFLKEPLFFEAASDDRRAKRRAALQLDEREIVYGCLAEFVVREMSARRGALVDLAADAQYAQFREMHIKWMLDPHPGLGGRSVRELMIDQRHEHLKWDLQDQSLRWSYFRNAPPGVSRDSAAYRDSGFGTHEIVLYYDLVREMLAECLWRMTSNEPGASDAAALVEHLHKYRQEWLNKPHDSMRGRTPAAMIDREKRRLPEAISGPEALIDPDCPACQAMADGRFGPGFWCLDGCEMDEHFAFSMFHDTLEEWEQDQRECEERIRQFNEEQKNRPVEDEDGDDFWKGDSLPE
ncbi:MAG: hypothetical protein K8T91_24005 [Planctomycetes bacterium]|nr:hypothetical protein [Planctomycetota bacterium]